MSTVAYVSLWLFVFAVPWENVVLIEGVGTIGRLMGIIALAAAVVYVVLRGRLRRMELYHALVVAFILWACAGAFWAIDPIRMGLKVWRFVQLGFVVWMIWELAPDLKRQRGLLLAYVAGTYVAAYQTFHVYRLEAGSTNVRFAAPGFDPNDLGMLLALGLPMAWYLSLTLQNAALRWVCRLYLPAGLMAIGLTASRGAMLASVVALSVIPFTLPRLSKGVLFASALVAVVSTVVVLSVVPASSWARFSTTESEVREGSLNDRRTIWMAGVRSIPKHPIHGAGPGGFDASVLAVLGSEHAAHNSFLSVTVEEGMIGLILFVAMLVAVFIRGRGLPSLERRFQLVVMLVLVVAMLPLTWEDRKSLWFILSLFVAQSAALRPRFGAPVLRPAPPPVARPPLAAPRVGAIPAQRPAAGPLVRRR